MIIFTSNTTGTLMSQYLHLSRKCIYIAHAYEGKLVEFEIHFHFINE